MSLTPEEAAKAIDKAFQDAVGNLSYTQTEGEAKATKLFICQSSEYLDLQAYLTLGMTMPGSDSRFQGDYPKSDLHRLIALDANIYGELQSGLVNVNNHCSSFQRDSMAKFLSVTNKVISYCNDTDKYITGKALLQDQLDILAPPDGLPQQLDKQQLRALSLCKVILTRLSTGAGQVQEVCDDLAKDLVGFKGTTEADQLKVKGLHEKFISPGPNNGQKEPYSKTLNGELHKLREDADELSKTYQREKANYDHDVVVAATSAAYGWIFPFGTIAAATVAGVYGDKAVKAKAAYLKAQAQLEEKNKEIAALIRCIGLVTHASTQILTVDTAIERAIKALDKLSRLFARLGSDLKDIADYFGNIYTSITGDPEMLFREVFQVDLDSAIAKWAEIKILATSFAANAPINWSDK